MLSNDWRPPIPLRLLAVAFALLSVVSVLQEFVGFTYSRQPNQSFDWQFSVSTALSSFLLWPLLCPLIYRASRRFRRRERPHFGEVAGQVLVSVVISLFHRVFAALLLYTVYLVLEGRWVGGFNDHTYSTIFVNVFSSFLVYWVLVGTFLAVDYYRGFQHQQLEMVKMENELNNAQLQALRMQLHPHFLFNTLHTISSLMDENVEQAQTMVSQMGYLLRGLLDQEHRATITLEKEMQYIRSYLDIEQTRFRDRLRIQYDIEDDTLDAQVPNLILQPLVENAIKHGFSRRTDSGAIRVSSRRDDGTLVLAVRDDGHGVSDVDAVLDRPRIGLQNVRKRLQQMYGDDAQLGVDSPNGRGFVASISIPFQTSGAPRADGA